MPMKLLFIPLSIFILSCSSGANSKKQISPAIDFKGSKVARLTFKREQISKEDILNLLAESSIITRDSGEEVNKKFVRSCLKKSFDRYVLFQCNDLLFDIEVKILGDNRNHILVVQNGASVENRYLFKKDLDGEFSVPDNNLKKIVSYEVVSKLIKEELNLDYSIEKLRMSAQSYFRLELVSDSRDIYLLSGDLYPEESHQRLAKLKFINNKFRLDKNEK